MNEQCIIIGNDGGTLFVIVQSAMDNRGLPGDGDRVLELLGGGIPVISLIPPPVGLPQEGIVSPGG